MNNILIYYFIYPLGWWRYANDLWKWKSRFCANGFTLCWNMHERQCLSGCLSRVFSFTISSRWWSSGRIPIINSIWHSAGAFRLFWQPSGLPSPPPIRQIQRKNLLNIIKDKSLKKMKRRCWLGYNLTPFYWILEGPRLTIIFINLLYLLNILRVLVTKLRNSQCSDAEQLR